MEKVEKLVTNLHDKTEYVSLVRNIKQVLNHGWISKKKHKAIKFSQEAWRKPHIDMNSKLRKKNKNDFKKDFFKLMNNPVFGKTVENMRKHRDIKRVTTEQRKLFSIRTKLSYYKFFHGKFIRNRNEKNSNINK